MSSILGLTSERLWLLAAVASSLRHVIVLAAASSARLMPRFSYACPAETRRRFSATPLFVPSAHPCAPRAHMPEPAPACANSPPAARLGGPERRSPPRARGRPGRPLRDDAGARLRPPGERGVASPSQPPEHARIRCVRDSVTPCTVVHVLRHARNHTVFYMAPSVSFAWPDQQFPLMRYTPSYSMTIYTMN